MLKMYSLSALFLAVLLMGIPVAKASIYDAPSSFHSDSSSMEQDQDVYSQKYTTEPCRHQNPEATWLDNRCTHPQVNTDSSGRGSDPNSLFTKPDPEKDEYDTVNPGSKN